jgi:zinc and cadmium transporter
MSLFLIIICSIIVSAIALIGGIFLFRKKGFNPTILVGFAAGVMLSTALLELLPESVGEQVSHYSFVPTFLGIITFFFLERFLLWFHHHDDDHNIKPAAYLVLLGDSIHNFIDGITIAAAFLTSYSIGFITTVTIAIHEIPQELADLGILISGGMSKQKALFYNFLSGLTALIGAIVGYFILSKISLIVPYLLGYSAGMFLYIACSDLIPELHHHIGKTSKWKQILPFLLGIIISILIFQLLPE